MKRKRQKRSHNWLDYTNLESRRLLAGNVHVSVNDSILQIVGDNLSNEFHVFTQEGNVQVEGIDTTVNGSSNPLVVTETFHHIVLSLRDGNDTAILDSVFANSNFSLLGGAGNDTLELNNVGAKFFYLNAGEGDDQVELDGVMSRTTFYAFLEDGDDILSVLSLTTGRNFKVYGGNGNDLFVSADLSVNRKFRLNLENGNDQALLTGNTSIGKRAKIKLGSGDDLFSVLPQQNDSTATFGRQLKIKTGTGNDTVTLGASVTANRPVVLNGGRGTDMVDLNGADTGKRIWVRRFETISNDNLNPLIDNFFATLAENGIDTIPFGDSQSADNIILTVSPTPLAFTENESPLFIDPQLQITGADQQEVASATVQITGPADVADSLLFEASENISGNFDTNTRTLMLAGIASLSEYQMVLRSIRFSNESDDPQTDDRTITVSVTAESTDTPIMAGRQLQITAVDDPLTLVLPAPFSSEEPITFNVGETINFMAEGGDPDSNFVFQLDLDESGISPSFNQPTIDSQSGQFSWDLSQTGTFPIRVIATNDVGESDQEEFTVMVNLLTTPTPTNSGLEFFDFEIGSGASPVRSDSVVVDYVGFLESNEIFDSGNGVTFPLTGVIEGFAEGIEGMQVGGRRRIVVPPELAYGPDGQFGDNPIFFDITLREIVS